MNREGVQKDEIARAFLNESLEYLQSICISTITKAVVLGSSTPSEGQSYGSARIFGSICASDKVEELGVSENFQSRYNSSDSRSFLLYFLFRKYGIQFCRFRKKLDIDFRRSLPKGGSFRLVWALDHLGMKGGGPSIWEIL